MSAPLGGREPPSEPASDSQQLSSAQNRADHAAAPPDGLATLSLAKPVPRSMPAPDPATTQFPQQSFASSIAGADSRPVPIPARAGDHPESLSSSFADAPLSLSPGTLRIASLSLVTPPSELVTSDMLGAAVEGVAALREEATAAGTNGARDSLADNRGEPTSNMLRAVAKGAKRAWALDSPRTRGSAAAEGSTTSNTVEAVGQGVSAPPDVEGPGTGGGTLPDPGGPGAACDQQGPPPSLDGIGWPRAAGSDAAASDVAKAVEQVGASRPPVLGPGVPVVDAGLLRSFMQAGPRCSLEQVTTAAHAAGSARH